MIKESGLSLDAARQRTVINSGDYFFQTIKEGETLRIVDLEGNQAADVLFFNVLCIPELFFEIRMISFTIPEKSKWIPQASLYKSKRFDSHQIG